MKEFDVTRAGAADVDAGLREGDLRRSTGDLRQHTARGMLLNGAYQIGLLGVSALRGVIAAAFLSRSDYGVWGLIGLTLWTAMGLKFVFGANEKYVQQSEENQERAFQRAFTIELIYASVTAPVAVAIIIAYALVTAHTVILAPGLVLLLLLPAAALQFPVAAFYRKMDYRRQRTLQAVEPATATILTVLLAILGAGYWSFVVGAVAGAWAGSLVALRACPYRLQIQYDRGTLRSYVGFSAPLLVSAIAVLAVFQVISLVGVGVLGFAGLGAFTLVGNLVQFTDQADTVITDTLYPAICAVRDRVGLLAEIFVKSNRLSLMWAVPFGVGMALFGADLVRFLIGMQWTPAIPLLEVMGIVTAVHHVGYNWAAFFKAENSTWPIAVSAVVTSTVVIGAGIPLMHSDHLLGIGYAFAAGEAVGLFVRGALVTRLFEDFRIIRQLLRAFAPTAMASVPVLGLRAFLGHERTLMTAAVMFALYVALTVAATVTLERPLLREAVGYMLRRRPQTA